MANSCLLVAAVLFFGIANAGCTGKDREMAAKSKDGTETFRYEPAQSARSQQPVENDAKTANPAQSPTGTRQGNGGAKVSQPPFVYRPASGSINRVTPRK